MRAIRKTFSLPRRLPVLLSLVAATTAVTLLACGAPPRSPSLPTSSTTPASASASAATGTSTTAPRPSETATARATSTGTATSPPGEGSGVRATRLAIPALQLDAPVQESRIIPDTAPRTPGCPAPPEGQTTLTVPDQGIATPVEPIDGLENKAWIFGHSRWLNQPGLFLGLQHLRVGDELYVDGVDRRSGARVPRARFVVQDLYLTDIESGGALLSSMGPEPRVILQTSAREDGPGKTWILDRQQVTARARSLIEGDVNDPCKYLLLFVVARPA